MTKILQLYVSYNPIVLGTTTMTITTAYRGFSHLYGIFLPHEQRGGASATELFHPYLLIPWTFFSTIVFSFRWTILRGQWTLGQNRTWTLKIKLMIHNRSHGISRTCSLPRSQRDCEETRTILWWPMQRPWIHKPWSAILYWYLYLIPSWRK